MQTAKRDAGEEGSALGEGASRASSPSDSSSSPLCEGGMDFFVWGATLKIDSVSLLLLRISSGQHAVAEGAMPERQ